jgi:DNA polymerase III alpha subunit
MSRNRGDIDIDLADRESALDSLSHVRASIIRDGKIVKHNTGVYFHAVPVDPVTGLCSIEYDRAEDIGCFKIDLLNVSVYDDVKDEMHLIDLMCRKLDWKVFEDKEFVSKLFHLSNHADLTSKLKPKSVEDIATVLALIRPGKRHLQNKCMRYGFSSIRNEIWSNDEKDGYVFKKAHSISYAMLVYVHANLLIEQSSQQLTLEQVLL